MGGSVGEVRGSTKIETYLAYVEEAEDDQGHWDPPVRLKKVCKRLMEKDPETEEWVLRYRWHT
jgi:hypothetical protein